MCYVMPNDTNTAKFHHEKHWNDCCELRKGKVKTTRWRFIRKGSLWDDFQLIFHRAIFVFSLVSCFYAFPMQRNGNKAAGWSLATNYPTIDAHKSLSLQHAYSIQWSIHQLQNLFKFFIYFCNEKTIKCWRF